MADERTKKVQARVTPETYELIREAARRSDDPSVSALVRRVVLHEVVEIAEDLDPEEGDRE